MHPLPRQGDLARREQWDQQLRVPGGLCARQKRQLRVRRGLLARSDGSCKPCAPARKSDRGNAPCERCFPGFDCGGDGTALALEELALKENWWRLSDSSTEAYECRRAVNATCPGSTARAGIEGRGCRPGILGRCARRATSAGASTTASVSDVFRIPHAAAWPCSSSASS